MSDYTVDSVLASRVAMDSFINTLSTYGLCNASGRAYRAVRLCRYKDGVLLVSYYHTDRSCEVMIAERPDMKIHLGAQNSTFHGDAMPRPDEGKWVSVWRDGKMKEGLWSERVRRMIFDSIIALEQAKADRQAKNTLARQAQIKAAEDYDERVRRAWA